MALYVVLDAPVITTTGTGGTLPVMRWCDYPGIRLLKKVSFDVNGNPLDSYTADAALFHSKFLVPPNKRIGWDKCMGQQSRKKGWLTPSTLASAVPDTSRVWVDVSTGPQTPMGAPQALTMFIPLLFWFNLDPRLAIPSVAIPHGQRFITLTLETAANLFYVIERNGGTGTTFTTPNISQFALYINNIFVNPS